MVRRQEAASHVLFIDKMGYGSYCWQVVRAEAHVPSTTRADTRATQVAGRHLQSTWFQAGTAGSTQPGEGIQVLLKEIRRKRDA